jgi:SAM-dependent methyltransferase
MESLPAATLHLPPPYGGPPVDGSGSGSGTDGGSAADGGSDSSGTDGGSEGAADGGTGRSGSGAGGGLPGYHRCPCCAHLKPPPRFDAAEVGCGTAGSLLLLARLGCRVAGIDIAQQAVDAARTRAARMGGAASERCAFMQADALALPEGWGWEAAKALERRQVLAAAAGTGPGCGTGASPAPAAEGAEPGERSAGGKGSGGFDFLFDCQAFHVLVEQTSPPAASAALARLLRPGGLLLLLAGNSLEPQCGPNTLSEAELRGAFADPESGGWEFVWLVQSRFDETPHYRDALGKRPLAWCALLRRL